MGWSSGSGLLHTTSMCRIATVPCCEDRVVGVHVVGRAEQGRPQIARALEGTFLRGLIGTASHLYPIWVSWFPHGSVLSPIPPCRYWAGGVADSFHRWWSAITRDRHAMLCSRWSRAREVEMIVDPAHRVHRVPPYPSSRSTLDLMTIRNVLNFLRDVKRGTPCCACGTAWNVSLPADPGFHLSLVSLLDAA